MKPIERDRRRGGRSRYRTASTDRASRPIDLPQQMVGWDMVFQAEVLEQPLRRRLPPHNRPPPRIPIRENGITFSDDANCMECHDTSVFTRKDRVVQSLDDLKKQLASCAHMAKKEFSESETQALLKYLNDQFYHFR